FEPVGDALAQDRRGEGAEAFAILNFEIERFLHCGRAWIAEDRTIAERAGPKFHPSLMPADRLSACKRGCRFVYKALIICDIINRAYSAKPLLDISLRIGGAEKGALHGVGLIDNSLAAGSAFSVVISGKRRTKSSARISGRWLNEDLVETAFAKNFSICHAI